MMKKKPNTIISGAFIALMIAIVSSVAFTLFAVFFTQGILLHLIIPIMSLLYTQYLMYKAGKTVGRVSLTLAWLIISLLASIVADSLALVLIVHMGIIWIVRTIYYHRTVWAAICDAGLVVAGIVFSLWAYDYSHSAFLTIWTFFFLQALHIYIPRLFKNSAPAPVDKNITYMAKVRQAEALIQSIYTKGASS